MTISTIVPRSKNERLPFGLTNLPLRWYICKKALYLRIGALITIISKMIKSLGGFLCKYQRSANPKRSPRTTASLSARQTISRESTDLSG